MESLNRASKASDNDMAQVLQWQKNLRWLPISHLLVIVVVLLLCWWCFLSVLPLALVAFPGQAQNEDKW